MTTNSTNSYSRQETLHNLVTQTSNNSTASGDASSSRLPPRTRPIVALPPCKLEPVLDVESTAVYEDAYCDLKDDRKTENQPSKTSAYDSSSSKNERCPHDSLRATQSHEMPGNRPPLWRHRAEEFKTDSRCCACDRGQGDHSRHAKDRSKASRHRSETTGDMKLLPSKLSFRSSRHHYRSDSHSTGHSKSGRNVYNSLDSDSTGSSHPRSTKHTCSADFDAYSEFQYSEYPDTSQMHPDDIFYPPGGSFQPYQAKYEPGCYKSSSNSGYHRPQHPPSPPVKDEPVEAGTQHIFTPELKTSCHSEKVRRHPSNFFSRSSSLQNLSVTEDHKDSGMRRRLARSASSHRNEDGRRPRSNTSRHRTNDCDSSISSFAKDSDSRILDYGKSRGRSGSRKNIDVENGVEQSDSSYYDSNHNLMHLELKNDVQRPLKCLSSDTDLSRERHRSVKKIHSHFTDTSRQSRNVETSTSHRQVIIFSYVITKCCKCLGRRLYFASHEKRLTLFSSPTHHVLHCSWTQAC